MHRFTAPTVLLTFTMAGCSGTPTAPTAAAGPVAGTPGATPSTASASVQTPISGSCEIQTTAVQVITPPVLRMVTTGTCQYSHLGRTQVDAIQFLNPALGTSEAEVTYTAANGDLLRATNQGTFTPSGAPTIDTVGVTTFTGGTGRFTGATGRLDGRGTVNMADNVALFHYEGWIVYDASQVAGR